MTEAQRKNIYTVIGIFVFVGFIAIIITLAILLSRRNQCFLGATEIEITGFEFEAVEDGIRVTWQKPFEMVECNPGYQITYNSTMGEFSTTASTESVTIPDDTFCYYFGIRVTPLTTLSRNSFGEAMYYENRDPVVEFSVESNTSPSTLVVNWTDPNEQWCSLAYKVEYQSPDGNQVFNVTTPEASFDFVYCTMSTLTIYPINLLDGKFFPVSISIDATQYPQKLEWPRNTTTTAWINRRETKWEPVIPIGTCNISYHVVFETDRGTTTVETEEPAFEIYRSSFCYSVDVIVYGVAGESVIEIIRYNPYWTIEIDSVSDLELTSFEENDTMIATWSDDPVRELCDLRYQVTIQQGSSGIIIPTIFPQRRFPLVYCVNTTVSVRTTFNARTGQSSVVSAEVYPTSLEPVNNVVINTIDTTAFVSWEVAESLQKCTDLFNVTAINEDINEQSECLGVTGCEISLSSFCPYTNFTIKPTLPIEGDAIETRYSCALV